MMRDESTVRGCNAVSILWWTLQTADTEQASVSSAVILDRSFCSSCRGSQVVCAIQPPLCLFLCWLCGTKNSKGPTLQFPPTVHKHAVGGVGLPGDCNVPTGVTVIDGLCLCYWCSCINYAAVCSVMEAERIIKALVCVSCLYMCACTFVVFPRYHLSISTALPSCLLMAADWAPPPSCCYRERLRQTFSFQEMKEQVSSVYLQVVGSLHSPCLHLMFM